jgi:hypothetical protein
MKVVRQSVFVLALFGLVAGAVAAQAPPAAANKKLPFPMPPAAPAAAATPTPIPAANVPTTQQSYVQFMEEYNKPLLIPKKTAVLLGNGRVRAHRVLGTVFKIVGEQGDNYVVRNLPPEDPDSPIYDAWLIQQGRQIYGQMKTEYFADKYLVVDEPDVPPPFVHKLSFVRRDTGLPRAGHWQVSLDVADMNGDGRLDLVLPPQRMGDPHPLIFLQNKDGSWGYAADARWPTTGLKLDYGTVRVADFDGDGNKDIAIACHFSDVYVLYGDGKGDFTRFQKLPLVNPNVSGKALTVADFNRDGRPDLAMIAETDLTAGTSKPQAAGLVNVILNLPGGWKATSDTFPAGIMGDSIASADIFQDGWPALLLTSRSQNQMDMFFRNVGKGEKFVSTASLQVPVNSFIFGMATGHFDRFKTPDVVMCFEQVNPWMAEPATQACAIYRFHDAAGKPISKPTASVFVRRKVEFDTFNAVAVGDVDGDGRDDVVVATNSGQLRLFLQQPDGRLFEEKSPDLVTDGSELMDVRIADLHGDGHGEIIAMGAPSDKGQGGVWVFSPRPLAGAAAPAKTGP